MILGLIFCKKNKVLDSEIFLKPLENPTLITDDSLTFFQLPGSSRHVELLGGAQAGMLGCAWVLPSPPSLAPRGFEEKGWGWERHNPGSRGIRASPCQPHLEFPPESEILTG